MTTPTEPGERPKWLGPSPDQVIRAAVLCFIDDESDEEIAAELGICRRTLARWKLRTDFAFAERAMGEYLSEQAIRDVVRRVRRMYGPAG